VDLTDERIAQNQSTFRDANERIEKAAQGYRVAGEIPFICECADPTCSDILRLSLSEYELVRVNPRQFAVARGHQSADGSTARVVAEHETFTIAEKTGRAGQIAAQLDPRSDTQASSTG
jgi:hypothetical protein